MTLLLNPGALSHPPALQSPFTLRRAPGTASAEILCQGNLAVHLGTRGAQLRGMRPYLGIRGKGGASGGRGKIGRGFAVLRNGTRCQLFQATRQGRRCWGGYQVSPWSSLVSSSMGNSEAAPSSPSTHLSWLAGRCHQSTPSVIEFCQSSILFIALQGLQLGFRRIFFPPQGRINHQDIIISLYLMCFFWGGKESTWEEKIVERQVRSSQQTVCRLYSFHLDELVLILPPPPLLPLLEFS